MRKTAIWAGLETLYLTGAHRLARPLFAGIGAILTFHRVRSARDGAFQPNRGLEIEPQFLDEALTALRAEDIDIISLDEAWRRLVSGEASRRFVVLTFDDGYRDVLENAVPILRRHQAPFTVYVTTAFADGTGTLWWAALEEVVARSDSLDIALGGVQRHFDTSSIAGKDEAFCDIYWWLRESGCLYQIRDAIQSLAASCGLDTAAQCRSLCLNWAELGGLIADPLVTIGSHTVDHPFLSKVPEDMVRSELIDSRRIIGEKLGRAPDHLAYPVGAGDAVGPREYAIASEIGYRTAVTTRPGVLFAEHKDHLTALPRISVNGDFQRRRFLDVLLSGAPTALLNGFRRVAAA
jgi:peptidoglycan/xylan/chitin deacetylase (PgdA/CDA1 family)